MNEKLFEVVKELVRRMFPNEDFCLATNGFCVKPFSRQQLNDEISEMFLSNLSWKNMVILQMVVHH